VHLAANDLHVCIMGASEAAQEREIASLNCTSTGKLSVSPVMTGRRFNWLATELAMSEIDEFCQTLVRRAMRACWKTSSARTTSSGA